MIKHLVHGIILFALLTTLTVKLNAAPPEEGMYPLSELLKLDLKSAGLRIDKSEVYNTSGSSLVNALVKIGGCTGSFVSANGLILTNHHCVFDFVRQASTVDKNYLDSGFYAPDPGAEIPAQGLTCKITDSYTDVSAEVLEGSESAATPKERLEIIKKNIKKIEKAEALKHPDLFIEISEMFTGKNYVLFRYQLLKDVRLVYIPPRSIGDFGGDIDNWVWPRHTGDFSFIRAYTGKNGKPAEYSPDNIPFTPRKFLKVNANGANENDFVFILGYPGRTYRNQPAGYIDFQEKVQLPYTVALYRDIIHIYEEQGSGSAALALKVSSRIKSLANTRKNFEGKLLGLRRLEIVDKLKNDEEAIREFIRADKNRAAVYAGLLDELNKTFTEQFTLGRSSLFMQQMRYRIVPSALAQAVIDYKKKCARTDSSGKALYSAAELKKDRESILEDARELDKALDVPVMKRVLTEAASFAEMSDIEVLKPFAAAQSEKHVDEIRRLLDESVIYDSLKLRALLESDDAEDWRSDKLIKFMLDLNAAYTSSEKKYEDITGRLNQLLPKYYEIKSLWKQDRFIPDANSTLRLTYGYIRGYSPADATYYKPFTTLTGAIEKSSAGGVFALPDKLKEIYRKKNFGRYRLGDKNDVPLALLYNLDTTGGNSGSPLLNADGELIGVNYDRAFEATINDYAWSESYSRSIAVDIRYVLFITEKLGGAERVIQELSGR